MGQAGSMGIWYIWYASLEHRQGAVGEGLMSRESSIGMEEGGATGLLAHVRRIE